MPLGSYESGYNYNYTCPLHSSPSTKSVQLVLNGEIT